MARRIWKKAKLLDQVPRIRKQIDAIERALEAEQGCATALRRIASAKVALNVLMVEVIEGNVCPDLLDGNERRPSRRAQVERELHELIRSYVEAAGGDNTIVNPRRRRTSLRRERR